MGYKELSAFKYKRRIDINKWFDNFYDGKFGVGHFTLSNNKHGVIQIYNTETKEHIVSVVRGILYTNNLSLCN